MGINDEIITIAKLKEFDKVSHFDTWEESKRFVNTSVLGEMDWYLIDGIMRDYLFSTGKEARKFEKVLKEVCNSSETIHYLKEIADEFEPKEPEKAANNGVITAQKIVFFSELMHLDWKDIKDLNPIMFGTKDWTLLTNLTNDYFIATKIKKSKELQSYVEKDLTLLCDNELTIEIFKEFVSDLELENE